MKARRAACVLRAGYSSAMNNAVRMRMGDAYS